MGVSGSHLDAPPHIAPLVRSPLEEPAQDVGSLSRRGAPAPRLGAGGGLRRHVTPAGQRSEGVGTVAAGTSERGDLRVSQRRHEAVPDVACPAPVFLMGAARWRAHHVPLTALTEPESVGGAGVMAPPQAWHAVPAMVSRPPLIRLHGEHSSCRLSSASMPPLARGTMWSRSKSSKKLLRPQPGHGRRSPLPSLNRTGFGGGSVYWFPTSAWSACRPA